MALRIPKPIILVFTITISFFAAGIGNLATIPNIPTWYAALEKPLLNPPNWIFGPVWTTLYILMGIALYLVIVSKNNVKNRRKIDLYVLYGAQLSLNALWSVTFFGLHLIEASIAVILLLNTSIILMIIRFWPYSPLAGKLLIPYALWVSFATYLTISIAVVN